MTTGGKTNEIDVGEIKRKVRIQECQKIKNNDIQKRRNG